MSVLLRSSAIDLSTCRLRADNAAKGDSPAGRADCLRNDKLATRVQIYAVSDDADSWGARCQKRASTVPFVMVLLRRRTQLRDFARVAVYLIREG